MPLRSVRPRDILCDDAGEAARPRLSPIAPFPAGEQVLSHRPTLFPLSAVILVRNHVRLLPTVLAALHWCDEVLVIDAGAPGRATGVTDRFSNVTLVVPARPFPGCGPARRAAVAQARHDWILGVEADEVLSPSFGAGIRRIRLNPANAYSLPLRKFPRDRPSGDKADDDRRVRLFYRHHANFADAAAPEPAGLESLNVEPLDQPILTLRRPECRRDPKP